MIYKYSTGRTYDAPQVLEIHAPALPGDLFEFVRVTFHDASRRISGAVMLMVYECLSYSEIGHAALREYDAGRYEQI